MYVKMHTCTYADNSIYTYYVYIYMHTRVYVDNMLKIIYTCNIYICIYGMQFIYVCVYVHIVYIYLYVYVYIQFTMHILRENIQKFERTTCTYAEKKTYEIKPT